MTLSDPRRALLPLALALACATTATPVLAQGLQTSVEPALTLPVDIGLPFLVPLEYPFTQEGLMLIKREIPVLRLAKLRCCP